jgi:hypothetical protein
VFGLVKGLSGLFGASAGFDAGEMFVSATAVGTKDLVRAALPDFERNR